MVGQGISQENFPSLLSFDDILIEPGRSNYLPSDVNISTRLGPINCQLPILSAAMDTVTEDGLAISMALQGGVGVIHKNNSIIDQSRMVKRVKSFQHAVILKPLTVRPDQNVKEIKQMMSELGVSGFPVVDSDGKILGMCTGRDIRYALEDKQLVKDVMSSPAKVLPFGADKKDTDAFFRAHKVEKLPLVDSNGVLQALITSKDWRHHVDYPNAVKDAGGNLIAAAAVGVGSNSLERVAELALSGADMVVVDSAHGHSENVLKMVSEIKKKHTDLVVSGGNVATIAGAEALIDAGADVVKIGIGPGSICTTRIVSGIGVPQFSAIYNICSVLRKKHPYVSFIADGGIRYSGDITKALAAGAHAVMIGSLFAGTEESPGKNILYGGRRYKSYRGMGSLGAMKDGSKDRYRQSDVSDSSKLVPEGVEARVPYRGQLKDSVHQLVGGLRAGMGYVGSKDLNELVEKVKFQRISNSAYRESHVHDVTITSEASNYSGSQST